MVQIGGGAVLATSAVGMLVVCNVHVDDDGVFVIGEGIVSMVIQTMTRRRSSLARNVKLLGLVLRTDEMRRDGSQ